MRPYCDRPHCVRQFAHGHDGPEPPDSASGATESGFERPETGQEPESLREAPERSVKDEAVAAGRAMLERARSERLYATKSGTEITLHEEPEPGTADAWLAENRPEVLEPAPEKPKRAKRERKPVQVDPAHEREWADLSGRLQAAEDTVAALRRRRVELLEGWSSAGMSYEAIGAVTGLTRQRVGQLLRRPRS